MGIVPLTPDRLALYLLDVSGHGVGAALLFVHADAPAVAGCGGALLTEDTGDGPVVVPPSRVAERLNRQFPMESDPAVPTLVYGVIDPLTGRFDYVTAGHPSPVKLPGGGVPFEVEGAGLPVGMLDDAAYEDVTLTLEPGDRLYFYTDGVIEALDAERNGVRPPAVAGRHCPAARSAAARGTRGAGGGGRRGAAAEFGMTCRCSPSNGPADASARRTRLASRYQMLRSRHHRNVGAWRTTDRLDCPAFRAYSWAGTWQTRRRRVSARRTISSSIECRSSVSASSGTAVARMRPEAVLGVGQRRAEPGVDDLRQEVVAPEPDEHGPRPGEFVAAPAHAAPDHEVRLTSHNRPDERRDLRRVVRAVGVHRHHDVTRRRPRGPVRIASPFPRPWSSMTVTPAARRRSGEPSVLWPSTTMTSSQQARTAEASCTTMSPSFREGMMTVVRISYRISQRLGVSRWIPSVSPRDG